MGHLNSVIKISSKFAEVIHKHSSAVLKTIDKDELDNKELIDNGQLIASKVLTTMKPKEIHALMNFHTSPTTHIVVSSGLKTDLPDTPYDGLISNKEILEPVLFVTAIHALLGLHPVVYEGENDGRIVRNVVPAKKSADMISSHGSRIAFGGHVDNPDLPLFNDAEKHSVTIPDNLSLFCLKQQSPAVPTEVISLDKIITSMNAKSVSRLMQPLFTVERPASFHGYIENYVSNVPLVAKDNSGQYVSRFDVHRVTTNDDSAADALEEFKAVATSDEVKEKLEMQAGDFVLFKNKRTLHARGAFKPVFDGNDRWLLRVFSMNAKPDKSLLVLPTDPAHLKTDINSFNL